MSAKKPRKTAARNGGPKNGTPEPELIPQPHGGALLSWPKPNHPPGPGRPPSALRAELRTILEGGLDILRDIIAGKVTLRLQRKCEKCGHVPDDKAIPIPVQTAVQDALRAIDLAGKYGIGVVKGVSDNVVREKLQQTIDIIGRELPAEEAERILGLLETRVEVTLQKNGQSLPMRGLPSCCNQDLALHPGAPRGRVLCLIFDTLEVAMF